MAPAAATGSHPPSSQVASAAMLPTPLAFVVNVGQTDPQARAVAQGQGATLFFTSSAIVMARPLQSAQPGRPLALDEAFAVDPVPAGWNVTRIDFVGASTDARITVADPLPGSVNYFRGSNPSGWLTNQPTYGALIYDELYPGIDLHYEGSGVQLKGTYVVAPGADPTRIRWRYSGTGAARIDHLSGDLRMDGGDSAARLIERAPVAWQDIAGQRLPVDVRFRLAPDGSVSFAIPSGYDPTQPLILDPTLVYATYLGGTGEDNADGVAVDGSGNMVVSGLTASLDFPTTVGVVQATSNGVYDVYVTKTNATGSTVLYSTYIGGSGATDYGLGLAVDTAGNAYVTGVTDSTDFPVADAAQAGSGGAYDAFLAVIGPAGDSLLYSTYLGGAGLELGFDVVAEPTGGIAYLTGRAEAGFPTSATAYRGTFTTGDVSDGFVSRIDTNLTGAASLTYSTYVGGTGEDRGNGITVDPATDVVYVTGRTASGDFPVTGTAFQATLGGSFDAYVLSLDTTVSGVGGLGYATYLGGSGNDRGLAITRDAANNVYLTGHTLSIDFPTSVGAPDTTCGTDGACNSDGSQSFFDAFVARIDPAQSGPASRVYATYLGGERRDEGEDIVVDSATGEAYLTGYTNSTIFPTVNALQSTCGWGCGRTYSDPLIEGYTDAFITRLNAPGTQLVMSTYLGGNSADFGFGLHLDEASDTLFVVGETYAVDFPLVSPLQSVNNGHYEVFLLKLDDASSASADLAVTQIDSPDPIAAGGNVSYQMTVTNNGPSAAPGVRLTHEIPEGLSISVADATASQGTCTLIFSSGASCLLGDLTAGASRTVTVTVNAGVFAVGPVFTSTVGVASNVSDPDGNNNRAQQVTTLTQSADLSVVVADTPDPVEANQALTYTIDIANAGPSIATGTVLTDTLPVTVTFGSVSTTQGTCAGTATIVCDLGDLWPAATAQVTIVVTTTTDGGLTNLATVAAASSDPTGANNTLSTSTTVGTGGPALGERLYLTQISRFP